MTTAIRNAVDADVDALIALSVRTISASYRAFLDDAAVDGFIGSGAVNQYVKDNLARCVVILCDGSIVGYAVWQDNWIDLMMIDHTAHRQGFGTQLLKHVEASLLRSYDALTLESFEANQQANSFYRKNGWLEASRYFDNDSGANKIVFNKIVFNKRL